jgi:hypothetical protein
LSWIYCQVGSPQKQHLEKYTTDDWSELLDPEKITGIILLHAERQEKSLLKTFFFKYN